MKMFSIYDVKAEGYNTPFFQPTFGLAERMFNEALKDEKSAISKYPEDFSLYYHGEIDTNTGLFIAESKPKLVVQGSKLQN